MKFKIYGTTSDGAEDYLVIEGESVEEIREKADSETRKRNWKDCWSEEIK